MKFALVSGNSVIEYPINLKEKFPMTSFPDFIGEECLPEGVMIVNPTPSIQTKYQHAEETASVVDGVCVQVWRYWDKTPEECAAIDAI